MPKNYNYPIITEQNQWFNSFLCFITITSLVVNTASLLTPFWHYTTPVIRRHPGKQLIKTSETTLPSEFRHLLIAVITLAFIEGLILLVYISFHAWNCLDKQTDIQSEESIIINNKELRASDTCFGDATYFRTDKNNVHIRLERFVYLLLSFFSVAQTVLLSRCALEYDYILTPSGKMVFGGLSGLSAWTALCSFLYYWRYVASKKRVQELVSGTK